jgi:hypothetical protein
MPAARLNTPTARGIAAHNQPIDVVFDLVRPVGPAGALPENLAGARKISLHPTTLSRAESSQPWQLEGGPSEIDPGDGAENVDLDSFYPSHYQSRISPRLIHGQSMTGETRFSAIENI